MSQALSSNGRFAPKAVSWVRHPSTNAARFRRASREGLGTNWKTSAIHGSSFDLLPPLPAEQHDLRHGTDGPVVHRGEPGVGATREPLSLTEQVIEHCFMGALEPWP